MADIINKTMKNDKSIYNGYRDEQEPTLQALEWYKKKILNTNKMKKD